MIQRLFVLILGVALASVCFAQAPAAPKVTAKLSSKAFQVGKPASGSFSISFAEGMHGYQNPPTSEFLTPVSINCKSKGVKFLPKYPKGVMKMSTGEETAVYEGTVEIPFTLTLPKKAGKHTLDFEVQYQQCDENNCWPPAIIKISVVVTVTK